MISAKRPEASIIVIFGAGGDLAWRKLVPALYNLHLEDWLPEKFAVLGVDMKDLDDGKFRERLRDGVDSFSRRGKAKSEQWNRFSAAFSYKKLDLQHESAYKELAGEVESLEREWNNPAEKIFYLAMPPSFIETITKHLGKSSMTKDHRHSRVVIEKPFGRDLESAHALNRMLRKNFREDQIYRIDHYLGKETVQNILAFRFANVLFEPIWNRNYIDHVQITVGESVGIGHRAAYYDNAGALRDMIQNHLLQLLCLIAMEPPVSFHADEVRNRKVDVLHAIRKFRRKEVHEYAVRGQYGPGWIEGEHVAGYREEDGIAEDSTTETFAAVKLFVDNWRWQDVPFYLRTGKRLPGKTSMITIQFRPVPHQSFPSEAVENWVPNRLILTIQPEKDIRVSFQAKRPGLKMLLNPVDMHFNYSETYTSEPPEAYETLLLDVMLGDATLFMRADQVEASWEVITPILEFWESTPPLDFPNYAADSWGPGDAEALIAKDGHTWVSMPLMKRIEIQNEKEKK